MPRLRRCSGPALVFVAATGLCRRTPARKPYEVGAAHPIGTAHTDYPESCGVRHGNNPRHRTAGYELSRRRRNTERFLHRVIAGATHRLGHQCSGFHWSFSASDPSLWAQAEWTWSSDEGGMFNEALQGLLTAPMSPKSVAGQYTEYSAK